MKGNCCQKVSNICVHVYINISNAVVHALTHTLAQIIKVLYCTCITYECLSRGGILGICNVVYFY